MGLGKEGGWGGSFAEREREASLPHEVYGYVTTDL